MTLKDLRIGESAKITAVGGEGALRQHFWCFSGNKTPGSTRGR